MCYIETRGAFLSGGYGFCVNVIKDWTLNILVKYNYPLQWFCALPLYKDVSWLATESQFYSAIYLLLNQCSIEKS